MTNFSLCDYKEGNIITGSGCDRYEKVQTLLADTNTLDVNGAFKVLEATRQIGAWNTEFSMVYSQKENAVYYYFNGNFNDITKYSFEI